MSTPVVPLEEAVRRHVRAGDAVHVVTGHTRWTAAAREVIRQWWGKDPGFTLVMLSLSSLGAVFFRGGLLSKVVTGYSGDVFPNFTPNRWFGDAYLSGEVEVEHWSFLTFLQRLEAAARGLPAVVTTSLQGSSMADERRVRRRGVALRRHARPARALRPRRRPAARTTGRHRRATWP